MIRHIVVVLTAISLVLGSVASHAQSSDLIVEKKTFELPSYTTVAGETIKSVKIGWEAAGTLNADKSNAILVTHYFTGTSHAFGKYAPADKIAGYWDAIIGPGKAIDTNKYYVLSSDTLVNLCQAVQRRDDGACEHQSRDRQALRHELSGGQHQGFR
jgi:homoserine O-acetyltransferase